MDASYITAAGAADQLPKEDQRELAFMGRSNSGKSTFLNALMQRRNLARASATPGRTQAIHFFAARLTAQCQLVLADLPGYGFAKVDRTRRKTWDPLMSAFFERPQVWGVFYISDLRRLPDEMEVEFLQELTHKRVRLWVVLTKADKLSRKEAHLALGEQTRHLEAHGIVTEGIFPVALVGTKSDLTDVRQAIVKAATQSSEDPSAEAPSSSQGPA